MRSHGGAVNSGKMSVWQRHHLIGSTGRNVKRSVRRVILKFESNIWIIKQSCLGFYCTISIYLCFMQYRLTLYRIRLLGYSTMKLIWARVYCKCRCFTVKLMLIRLTCSLRVCVCVLRDYCSYCFCSRLSVDKCSL